MEQGRWRQYPSQRALVLKEVLLLVVATTVPGGLLMRPPYRTSRAFPSKGRTAAIQPTSQEHSLLPLPQRTPPSVSPRRTSSAPKTWNSRNERGPSTSRRTFPQSRSEKSPLISPLGPP